MAYWSAKRSYRSATACEKAANLIGSGFQSELRLLGDPVPQIGAGVVMLIRILMLWRAAAATTRSRATQLYPGPTPLEGSKPAGCLRERAWGAWAPQKAE